jgi:hypothetical protein
LINIIARYAKPLLLIATAAAITGCDIGDGNKIESISIDGTVNTVRLDDCIGSQLLAVATFTDGTRVNFTDRVNWSSDNSDVIAITTRPTDRPANFDEDFGFVTVGSAGSEGSTANISIEYFGLTNAELFPVTATGSLVDFGLSINDATMAKGTRQSVSFWGRTSNDERVDLTQQTVFSVDDTASVTLDEDFQGGVTATEVTTSPATLSSVYCSGDTNHQKTATASLSIVEDAPSGLILSATATDIARGTISELSATATYSNGGIQNRRTSTRFSQTSPGETAELLFSNSFGVSSTVGNFRVTPVATSGTHQVSAQYVDLSGEDVASATGTIDLTLINTQLQSPAYRLDRGENVLVGTNVDLAVIGLFDVLDDNDNDIGDYQQDVTDFSQITFSAADIDKVVVGNGVALGVGAGTTEITVSSSTDSFTLSEIFSVTTHDDTGVVVNSITVSTEKVSHKVYRLRASANVTTSAGATFDQDVSLNAVWSTANNDIIHVDNSALNLFAFGLVGDAGCTAITAHFKGQTGTATINGETGDSSGCP